jgi:miniconductance mechanosensitive channel
MQESDGRRIKRSINIDMKSVKFLDNEMIDRLKKIHILKPYLDQRLEEIKNHNEAMQIDPSIPANGRRMTNLGTFRKYMEAYIGQLPAVNKELTLMVRQKDPTDKGIPLEIYAFSKEKGLIDYENLQADIFDHMLAVIPEFGLRVFQSGGSNDNLQNQV